jgi:thioredoxin reductase
MALGRALRRVLIIDSGVPCNRQTPLSHNFLTHDGTAPSEIAALGRRQVKTYSTVEFADGLVTGGMRTDDGFALDTADRRTIRARRLIFATGIRDNLPPIGGLAECWGISALHCPYCHGYEVKAQATAVMGNGDSGFDLTALVANGTQELTLLTNGPSTLTADQSRRLGGRHIKIFENELERIDHLGGHLERVVFKDDSTLQLQALYLRPGFEQHSAVPADLGCELTEQGYLRVGPTQATTVPGVYACGDNSSSMRTVANAVATGTTAGMMANRELALDEL